MLVTMPMRTTNHVSNKPSEILLHVNNQPAERTTHVSKAVKITSPSRGQQVTNSSTVSEMHSNNKYQ